MSMMTKPSKQTYRKLFRVAATGQLLFLTGHDLEVVKGAVIRSSRMQSDEKAAAVTAVVTVVISCQRKKL
jgi:hypothetical protein